MAQRISIIEVSSSVPIENRPSWTSSEIQEFQRTFLKGDGGITEPPATSEMLKIVENTPNNNTVLVKAGVSFIKITKNSRIFRVRFENTEDFSISVPENSSGSARVDRIIARVDTVTEPDSSAQNIAILEILEGGATAPATPENSISLATLNVAAGQATFTNSDITDTRTQILIDEKFLSLTKNNVGLENVENFGIASQLEAESGTATDKYMTPQRVAQAISQLGGSVSDAAFSSAWNGDVEGATKNTLYAKFNEVTSEYGIIPSETILANSSATVYGTGTAGLAKKKEITINDDGEYRIFFDLKSNSQYSAPLGQAQIYKNGVAYGTLQTYPAYSTSRTYTEDLIFSAGDKVQLYMGNGVYNTSSQLMRNENFQVKADKAFIQPTATVNL